MDFCVFFLPFPLFFPSSIILLVLDSWFIDFFQIENSRKDMCIDFHNKANSNLQQIDWIKMLRETLLKPYASV